MGEQKKVTSGLLINSLLGFFGLLLIILLLALAARIYYPRLSAERTEKDPVLISDIIQIEVLNGCGVPGLANRYTQTLRSYGFDVVESGNFDHFDVENTIIISRRQNIDHARRLASALNISPDQILREVSDEYFLDLTLILGRDHESLNL